MLGAITVWGRDSNRSAAGITLALLAAVHWLGQLRDEQRIVHLTDLVRYGTRTIQRGTALANFTAVQTDATKVLQDYADSTSKVSAAALQALVEHDPALAAQLTDWQLNAMAALEEHLPDVGGAAQAYLKTDAELSS